MIDFGDERLLGLADRCISYWKQEKSWGDFSRRWQVRIKWWLLFGNTVPRICRKEFLDTIRETTIGVILFDEGSSSEGSDIDENDRDDIAEASYIIGTVIDDGLERSSSSNDTTRNFAERQRRRAEPKEVEGGCTDKRVAKPGGWKRGFLLVEKKESR